ncbi:MAG: hypothetical protein J6M62_10210 [Selenomonadaceae bacterium]|nr:hypothetical protein [Selenomonadaceae bacterium]
MTPRERQALMRVIFYLLSCISYIAGARVPDDIGREIEILEKGESNAKNKRRAKSK